MQALRLSSYIKNYPLPTETLSVPDPFGNARRTWLRLNFLPLGLREARLTVKIRACADAGGDTTSLMTLKRKTSDEFSADLERENRSVGSTDQGSDVAPVSISEGASDGSGADQPFVKRARTSADEASVVTPSEPGGKGPDGGGDIEGEKAPETPPGGAEGAESSSREREDAAEREKKLALRRLDRGGRSFLSSKKTTERPPPKIALPISLRLSDVEARRDSDVGAGWWMTSAPPKTPRKVNRSPM